MIKNHLVSAGKFQPKKEIVFIPVKGASGVKPVVSILQGAQGELPFTLLDSDSAGKQFQQNLKNGFYQSNKEMVLETDIYCGLTGSEIEDLMPLELLVDSFDRIFRSEDGITINDVDASKPIVPQLKAFGAANELGLEENTGWKVELSARVKKRFDGQVDAKLEKSWVTMFEAMQV